MKPASGDDQNESTEMPWPRVLRIASSDEFQQSFAVAQLAVKLWENKMARLNSKPLEKENVKDKGPAEFLAAAWELIQSAHEHVLRPQSDAEYLVAHGGSHEAAENVVGRILSAWRVPFEKLCDPEYHNKEDSVTVYGLTWEVYRSEAGFNDLFQDYWRYIAEQWKDGKKPPGPWTESEREALATVSRDKDAWKKRGLFALDSWKHDGVPPNNFLALARFRKERDNGAENLKRKPKRKRLR